MHPASDINERVMQELNHRIKNNLQVVSSILDLQVEFAGQKTTEAILNSMKQRIQSMAVLHDQLNESDERSRIEIAGFLKAVLDQTCILFSDNLAFKASTSLEKCWVVPQKLQLIGLVINELVMNALAFGKNETDEVILRLEGYEKDGIYILILSDQGIGFEDNEQIRNQKLGLRLVDGLIKQMNGVIERLKTKGTVWKIQIPVSN